MGMQSSRGTTRRPFRVTTAPLAAGLLTFALAALITWTQNRKAGQAATYSTAPSIDWFTSWLTAASVLTVISAALVLAAVIVGLVALVRRQANTTRDHD
jgi:NADH:ubiquinone oxidoreductase subunit 6 (subunit J)